MTSKNNIYDDASLLKNVFMNDATNEEKLRADDLFIKHPRLKEQYNELRKPGALKKSFNNHSAYSGEEAYNQFLQNIEKKKQHIEKKEQPVATSIPPRKPKAGMFMYLTGAAAVLLFGLFLWQKSYRMDSLFSKKKAAIAAVVADKYNSASYVSGNNKSQSKGLVPRNIASYGSVATVPAAKQTASVNLLSSLKATPYLNDVVTEPRYSKYVVPRGQEKIVTLPDGTIVHLNSATTLTYPITFSGEKRVVILDGEAYFDVTKDPAHPFVVETNYGNVTVLGTAFDVNAYKGACYTTLVRGKVLFTNKANQEVSLIPGQQVIASNSALRKRVVDVNDYISWLNGYYNFNNQHLEDIMCTVERWYDVKVIFKDPGLGDLSYTGTLRKSYHVNSFMDMLEATGDVKYHIEGRDIYVYR